MSPQQINLTISEALGWKGPDHPDVKAKVKGWISEGWRSWAINPSGELVSVHGVKNYYASLDACAEMEAGLTNYQIGEYQEWIKKIVPNNHVGGHFSIIHATAPQRTEAYLRTLGLWVEQAGEGNNL